MSTKITRETIKLDKEAEGGGAPGIGIESEIGKGASGILIRSDVEKIVRDKCPLWR